MACRVEPPPFFQQAGRFEIGKKDSFLAVQRPGEVRAVGREDRAAASPEQVEPVETRAKGKVLRIRRSTLEMARRDDERARLAGNVDERRLPDVVVVRVDAM